MKIQVECNNCNKQYNVDEKFIGKSVNCKNCGHTFLIEEKAEDNDIISGMKYFFGIFILSFIFSSIYILIMFFVYVEEIEYAFKNFEVTSSIETTLGTGFIIIIFLSIILQAWLINTKYLNDVLRTSHEILYKISSRARYYKYEYGAKTFIFEINKIKQPAIVALVATIFLFLAFYLKTFLIFLFLFPIIAIYSSLKKQNKLYANIFLVFLSLIIIMSIYNWINEVPAPKTGGGGGGAVGFVIFALFLGKQKIRMYLIYYIVGYLSLSYFGKKSKNIENKSE